MTRTVRSAQLEQWRWPVGLALLTLFGLLSALLGDGGIWWCLSWVALGAPLFVIVYRLFSSQLTRRHAKSRRV